MKRTQSKAALWIALSLGMLGGCASAAGDDESNGDGDSSGDGDGDAVVVGSGGGAATGGALSSAGGDASGTGGTASGAGGGTSNTGGTSSASGGAENGSGGSSSGSACEPFADFEDSADGFGVYASDNAADGSLSTPAAGSIGGPAAHTLGDGADDSSGALVYVGSGFGPATPSAGPGGIRLAVDTAEACQDISGYTGVRFWAKGTVDATDEWGGIPANTVIVFAVGSIADEGGTEVDYRLTLNESWTLHQIPFLDFGVSGFSGDTVERLKFMLPGGGFNVAFDDVGYY